MATTSTTAARYKAAGPHRVAMSCSRVAGLRETWETVRSGMGAFPSVAQPRQGAQQVSCKYLTPQQIML